jgi:flagella basal body P-ring formation protein FlgA
VFSDEPRGGALLRAGIRSASEVWRHLGRNYEAGLGQLAERADITIEDLVEFLVRLLRAEARAPWRRWPARHWLDAVLAAYLLLIVFLGLRAFGVGPWALTETAVVATRDLPAGTSLRASDLRVVKRPAREVTFSTPTGLEGLILARDVAREQALKKENVLRFQVLAISDIAPGNAVLASNVAMAWSAYDSRAELALTDVVQKVATRPIQKGRPVLADDVAPVAAPASGGAAPSTSVAVRVETPGGVESGTVIFGLVVLLGIAALVAVVAWLRGSIRVGQVVLLTRAVARETLLDAAALRSGWRPYWRKERYFHQTHEAVGLTAARDLAKWRSLRQQDVKREEVFATGLVVRGHVIEDDQVALKTLQYTPGAATRRETVVHHAAARSIATDTVVLLDAVSAEAAEKQQVAAAHDLAPFKPIAVADVEVRWKTPTSGAFTDAARVVGHYPLSALAAGTVLRAADLSEGTFAANLLEHRRIVTVCVQADQAGVLGAGGRTVSLVFARTPPTGAPQTYVLDDVLVLKWDRVASGLRLIAALRDSEVANVAGWLTGTTITVLAVPP